MENSILNELLEKANKGGKKTDLSKTDQNTYRNEFMKSLSQEGINEDTVSYFVKGIKCGTAGALMNWMNKLPDDKVFGTYQSVLQSKTFTDLDSVSQFRITLALCATFLCNADRYDTVIADLMRRFVQLSRKKDGKRLTDLSKLFKAYFMDYMQDRMQLPILSKYHFDEEYEKQLVEMLKDAVEGISPKGDNEIDRRNILRKWIYANMGADTNPKTEASENASDVKVDSLKGTPQTAVQEPSTQDVDIRGALARKLLDLAKAVSVCERENGNVHEIISEKEAEISRLKMLISKYQSQIRDLTSETESLSKLLADCKEQLEKVTKENRELQDRIGRQSEVINVFDQDKDNSRTELLNQIAAGLKNIYADYKVAENMDMTVDLGLNMRDALQDVFRKLKKMGIDIEGR